MWFVEWPGHRGGISTNRPYAAIVTDVFDGGRVELYVLNILHARFEVSRLHDPTGQAPGSWRFRPAV